MFALINKVKRERGNPPPSQAMVPLPMWQSHTGMIKTVLLLYIGHFAQQTPAYFDIYYKY